MDKFSVSENFGKDAEMLENFLLVLYNLKLKLVGRQQAGERMVIGLRQKINATCFGEQTETVEHLRRIGLELVNGDSGDGKSDFDPGILFNELQQERIGGQIALSGYALNDVSVQVVIEVPAIYADVKKP